MNSLISAFSYYFIPQTSQESNSADLALSPLLSLILHMNVWSFLLCLRVQNCPLSLWSKFFTHTFVSLYLCPFSVAWIICSKTTILSLFPTMPPSSHLFSSQPAQPLDSGKKGLCTAFILQGTLLWPSSSFWNEKLEQPKRCAHCELRSCCAVQSGYLRLRIPCSDDTVSAFMAW